MLEPFIGEISWVVFDFVPNGWLACDGRELQVRQYPALYSLIGNRFGGSSTTFNLPNLAGRVAVGMGVASDSKPYNLGDMGGARTTVIGENQLPKHKHAATFTAGGTTPANVKASGVLQALVGVPEAKLVKAPQKDYQLANLADSSGATPVIYAPAGSGTAVDLGGLKVNCEMSGGFTGGTVDVGIAGAGAPMEIMQPYVTLRAIIAVEGIYPTRP